MLLDEFENLLIVIERNMLQESSSAFPGAQESATLTMFVKMLTEMLVRYQLIAPEQHTRVVMVTEHYKNVMSYLLARCSLFT